MPGVVEHVLLAAGKAVVGLAERPEALNPGDCLSYPRDQPHIFRALTPGTEAILISEHN